MNIYERPSRKSLDTHRYLLEIKGHINDHDLATFAASRKDIRVLDRIEESIDGGCTKPSARRGMGLDARCDPRTLLRGNFDVSCDEATCSKIST